MRKQIFVLLLLILSQANTEESNIQGRVRGKNKVIPSEKIGKTNHIDNNINAPLLFQQEVIQPNSHHDRHQAISQIKQGTDPSLSTQKIFSSKYDQFQGQTKYNLKDHINRLEKAETEEESKLCYDLIDDSIQSLIISENIVNQLELQQTIDSFKDTGPNKPKQEQPKTIDLDQNDEIDHIDSDPDKLDYKESSGSKGQDNKIEGSKINKGTQRTSQNKGKKDQGPIDDKVQDKSGIDRIIAPPIQNNASHLQSVSKQIDSKDLKTLTKNQKSFKSKKQITVKQGSQIFKDKVIEDQNNNQDGYSVKKKDYNKEDNTVAKDKIKSVSKLKKNKKIKTNKNKLKHTSKEQLQSSLNQNIDQVRFHDGQEVFTKDVINKTEKDIIGNNLGNKEYIKQARKLYLSTRQAKERNSSQIGKDFQRIV